VDFEPALDKLSRFVAERRPLARRPNDLEALMAVSAISEELDELRLLVVMDNATDMLSSVDEGVPQLPEMAHQAARFPVVRMFGEHECKVGLDKSCCACHGFSVLATGRKGGVEHTMLYDVGPYAHMWLANAQRLGIDLAKIEALFLSHWHADHSLGFPEVIAAIAAARRAAGNTAPLPVDLHPDRPDQRGVLHPSGLLMLHPDEPTFEAIEAAGGRVARHAEAHLLCGGFFYGSGEIPRVTAYEKGVHGHHTRRGENIVPDPLIMDERFLAARVRGRGVTVLSACSHAGVVNACLAAQQAFAPAPVDVVLGGYHLSGREMEKRIPATVRDLKERIRPNIVASAHCTGWRAEAALSAAFAPGHYGPSAVGTLYRLQAGGG
jgi:7,8-dihydropterin-6-yl-methyl-4-(beta-D-ribofuranosyl)aminobenzene 5'-phosphate synthase